MSSCEVVRFSGWAACQKLLAKTVGFILMKNGQTFTVATANAESAWKTKIAGVAGETALPFALKIYEKTTDDIEIQTSNLNIKDKTNDPVPSAIGYIKGSAEDYDTLWPLEGATLEAALILQDGTVWMTRRASGVIAGMKLQIALKADLSPADNAQNSFPVYLFFQDPNEFKRRELFSPDFTLTELLTAVPAGLSLNDESAYATGDITVSIYTRGTKQGYTGLAAADFEVLETNASDVSVTGAVDNGSGSYTLTIEKNASTTAAALAAGEYAIIRATDDDSTYYTYLSNALRVTA